MAEAKRRMTGCRMVAYLVGKRMEAEFRQKNKVQRSSVINSTLESLVVGLVGLVWVKGGPKAGSEASRCNLFDKEQKLDQLGCGSDAAESPCVNCLSTVTKTGNDGKWRQEGILSIHGEIGGCRDQLRSNTSINGTNNSKWKSTTMIAVVHCHTAASCPTFRR